LTGILIGNVSADAPWLNATPAAGQTPENRPKEMR
jgi:hypothetical protein